MFGKGIMKMMGMLKEQGKLPPPPPGAPPPPNPALLANAAPEGALGDALRKAGLSDVTAAEHNYPAFCAANDVEDAARRFIAGTPMHGMLSKVGGDELLAHGQATLAKIYTDSGHEMGDLASCCPEWKGPDNPDNLSKCLVFKENVSLYVTAKKPA